MRKYKLNSSPVEVMDGPLRGKKFVRGPLYDESEIPANCLHRFEEVTVPCAVKKPAESDVFENDEVSPAPFLDQPDM
jgi:hypothetical protein